MPAEQVIDLMSANFSGFKTLAVTQSVFRLRPDGKEIGIGSEQKLWLQAPDLFHLKGAGKLAFEETLGDTTTDLTYYRILLANDNDTILKYLSEMDVNTASVGLTRFEGVIVYRLGDKGTKRPQLLIEKKRFLPLYFIYRVPARWGTDLVKVRFKDYRKSAKGWYPYTIDYITGEGWSQRYIVRDLKVNNHIPYPVSKISRPSHSPQPSSKIGGEKANEDHIDSVIESLRKKYQ